RLEIDNSKLEGLEAPFVALVNHVSFYDFYYAEELLKKYNASYVINHHIFTRPVLKTIFVKCGMIPKKILCPDTAALKIMRTVKAGYPVVVFPEGRLSPDGRNSEIIENAAALYKKMGVPLVLTHIKNAYYTRPKWRSKFFKGDVSVSAMRVITPEELKQMSVEEIEKAIEENLFCEYNETPVHFPQKNKAKGLDGILYRCADCGELYSTKTKGNDIYCTKCGAVHSFDDTYHFTDDMRDIPTYYDRIKELERPGLADIRLETSVNTTIFSDEKPRTVKETGVCTLTKEAFTYRSDSIEFEIKTENLPALAFSCNEEFELYHDNKLYYFYPTEDKKQVARWSLIIDLLREERKGNGKEENAD
ncbi:MAG: 1-acyl-sn-glycerol-3-phosphate acyltransferase, partial [Clostridia bacterium]|nr:1-acyl-sn-glycerol-3-phosphate acyltransferase [Clostridia bacterium]